MSRSAFFLLPVLDSSGSYILPRVYCVFLLGLIAAYLAAIFKMDNIACKDQPSCDYTYTQLEWSFNKSGVQEALAAWNSRARAAMAFSAGLHIFSAFLFAQLFIFGGMQAAEVYKKLEWRRTYMVAAHLPLLGRLFSILYCAAHVTIGAMVVSGEPNASAPVAVGIVLIIALILLIVCALFLIISLIMCPILLRRCVASTTPDETEATALDIKYQSGRK